MPQAPDRPGDDQGPNITVEPLRYNPGDLVGEKVRLVELLGEGGMGAVWRAHHLTLDVDVAVKLLHGELISPETSEQLQREAHAAARLQHPSAVRVYDFGRTELGDSYIVMEFLKGESLADVLERRHHIPATETLALMLPVVGALAAAHARGIIHRDLKPENVVLVETADGFLVPKVVDFGIAKVDSPGRASVGEGDALLGSPAYMSPEHVLGEGDVDARSDVFSLGVVLYEMIAGKRPFVGNEPIETLRAIVDDDPKPLDQGGAADAVLAGIISRALAKDRAKRWPDMKTFGKELARWALASGIETDATGASIAIHWGLSGRLSVSPAVGSMPPERPPQPPAPAASRDAPSTAGPTSTAERTRSKPVPWLALFALTGLLAAAITFVVRSRRAAERAAGDAARSTAAVPAPPASGTTPAVPASAAAPAAPAVPVASAPASASASPAASALPAAATTSPLDCVEASLPGDSFQPDASLLGMCSESDPRRGAALIRGEVARHGLITARTTDAMRIWAVLSWYEMAAFAVLQHSCCAPHQVRKVDLPQTVGTCDPLGPTLDTLGAAVRADQGVDDALVALRANVTCIERGQRANSTLPSPYRAYAHAPSSGADAAFLKVLDGVRSRR